MCMRSEKKAPDFTVKGKKTIKYLLITAIKRSTQNDFSIAFLAHEQQEAVHKELLLLLTRKSADLSILTS